jgi:sugar lactone lactonase YvrE
MLDIFPERLLISASAPDLSCGESPVWDHRRQVLIFNDMLSECLYEYYPDSDQTIRLLYGTPVAANLLQDQNGFVLLGDNGIYLYSSEEGLSPVASRFEDEDLSINDAAADSMGRIYAGTCYWQEDGMISPGSLYMIDIAGQVNKVDEGLELANGIAISADGRTLYLADTTAREVYCYDVDCTSGALSRKRTFLRIPSNQGLPDGLAIDAEGFIWIAHWYGGRVSRIDPSGVIERQIHFPAQQVSNMTFGGDGLMDLYVTTASTPWHSPYMPPHYNHNEHDDAGSLFRLPVDIPGRAASRSRLLETPHIQRVE